MNRLVVVLALAFSCVPSQADDMIYLAATETKALTAKEGHKVTVYGESTGSAKQPTGTNFVNFEGAEFYLVTFKTDLDQFDEGEPAEIYDGQRLAVSGVMSVYQGKPQFKLTSPDQVRILGKDEVFPPEVKDDAPVKKVVVNESPVKKEAESAPEEPKRKPPVDPSEYFK